jgi:hypothetical protein
MRLHWRRNKKILTKRHRDMSVCLSVCLSVSACLPACLSSSLVLKAVGYRHSVVRSLQPVPIAISVPSQGSWLDDCFAGDANMPDARPEGMMQTRSTR